MSKSQQKQRKRTKNRRSFLLTLALIALIGYFCISLVSLQFQIYNKQQELNAVQTQYSQELKKNKELKERASEDDQNAYMERVARNVLGYAYPGESVYYDVSSDS